MTILYIYFIFSKILRYIESLRFISILHFNYSRRKLADRASRTSLERTSEYSPLTFLSIHFHKGTDLIVVGLTVLDDIGIFSCCNRFFRIPILRRSCKSHNKNIDSKDCKNSTPRIHFTFFLLQRKNGPYASLPVTGKRVYI